MNRIYQVWPISWIEPQYKGDNRSALRKVVDFVPRFARLGVKYLWLSPIFTSPWSDHGYDVADFTEIDLRFGTLKEFEQLIVVANCHGIGILLDLVLNHTSTNHRWFKMQPEYYCWSKVDKPGWKNLFDGGSSWAPYKGRRYLHLFSNDQADLNWFPEGLDKSPNLELVIKFRSIVDYWAKKGVAGFRLDAMQCINKDPSSDVFDPFATADMEHRKLAAKVINSVFNDQRANMFLLMECLDLSGDLVKYYYENTPVDAVMDNTPVNTLSITDDQSVTSRNLDDYLAAVKAAFERCPEGFAHVIESHDCPRFTTAAGVDGKTAIDILHGYYNGEQFIKPRTIVIYQGEELGLVNPGKEELTDEMMVELDAQTKMRFQRGESLDELRATSRANSRVAVPLVEYERQEKDENSCLNYCLTYGT
ncbi:hypothetical protein IKE98_02875 [Candidatus Saccharibacteria bacterium]|nr:hypothetical protein [Candidatus Saccharibacteria bacterium]